MPHTIIKNFKIKIYVNNIMLMLLLSLYKLMSSN
jgi:hypothetical protein